MFYFSLCSKKKNENHHHKKQTPMKTAKQNLHDDAKPQIFQNARSLRKNQTPAEQALWQALKGKQLKGFKFRRQHPIKKFVLDFYCHAVKLGIELDGKYHEDKTQQFYDKDRAEILEELGIEVIRFSNQAVLGDLAGVLEEIGIVATKKKQF